MCKHCIKSTFNRGLMLSLVGEKYNDQFNADKLATDLKDDSILYYVTRLDANPVGVIKLKLDQPIPGVEGQNGMELEKIYLRREFVGQGIGSNMMEMCLTLARDHHEDNIWLDVLKSNQRGIKFYQSYGYDIVGEIEFSTDLLNIGMFVMSKDLTNS